jgi:tetratricopeptide (TPR) repeat protein
MDASSPDRTPSARCRLLALLIAATTVATFLSSLRGEFLNWDDDANYLGNPFYRGLGLENLRWMFTDLRGHYMPLTWLTLGFDYAIWGMNTVGYHATSIALHAVNAVLLFFVLRRLLRAARPEGSEEAVDASSAAGALFFSIHPLRVESVAWLTERRDTVSCLFFLASVLLYLKHAAVPGGTAGRWKPLSLSVLCFAAMLLSKALGLTLPFILLILDAYPLRRFSRSAAAGLLREKLPFFILMVAGLAMLSVTADKAEGVHTREQYSYLQSLIQPGYRVCFYVVKTLIPYPLSPLYWYRPGLGARHVVGTVALLGITGGLWALRRRFPSGLTAWVSYGLLIAPASGIVQFGSIYAADRYTYVPCLPFAALFAGGVLALSPRMRPRPLAAAAGALLLGLAALASVQCRIWRDSVTLWTRAIELEPDVYFSRLYRGRALAAKGDWTLAMADYNLAVDLNPNWFEIWGSRARARLVLNDPRGALADASEALAHEPEWSEGHCVRGLALAKLGRPAEAEAEFTRALSRRPRFTEALTARATERALLGRFDGALRDLDEAIRFDPQPPLYLRRATVRGAAGDLPGALADLDEALRLKPDYADAYARRGMARLDLGRRAEAAQDLERALRLLPEGAPLRRVLSEALGRARTP